MGDSGDSEHEVGGLLGQLGQWQRAGLSVALAHELHTFLESQERSRFEELRLELLLQEKSWAVEASRIQKDLGNFGISNASHGSQSGSIEGLLPLEAEALAMTWRNKPYRNRNIRKGISGACRAFTQLPSPSTRRVPTVPLPFLHLHHQSHNKGHKLNKPYMWRMTKSHRALANCQCQRRLDQQGSNS